MVGKKHHLAASCDGESSLLKEPVRSLLYRVSAQTSVCEHMARWLYMTQWLPFFFSPVIRTFLGIIDFYIFYLSLHLLLKT